METKPFISELQDAFAKERAAFAEREADQYRRIKNAAAVYPLAPLPPLFAGTKICTHSGQYVDLQNPQAATIWISDIAVALSKEQRFGNHANYPISVATHSICVMHEVPPAHKLAALMHDASEAYLRDMPKPIKDLMPEYKALEDKLMTVIAQKFGFEYPLHYSIKEADAKVLEMEWKLWHTGQGKLLLDEPKNTIRRFLKLFNQLKKNV